MPIIKKQPTVTVRVPTLANGTDNNPTALKMAEHNKNIAMLNAQAQSDTAFDPPPGPRPTQAVFIENFKLRENLSNPLFVAGILLIIYGAIIVSNN